MRSQPYSGREKIGVANGGREWGFFGVPRARAMAICPPPYRSLSSAPFCVHSPQYDTTRIFARAHQVRAPLKTKGYGPAIVFISVDSDRSRLSPVAVLPRTASAARGTPRTEGGSALQ
jgi:hypothetical protein